jgi:4-diphosphocytidyl-2-C-methyl-D-erythritol kinase
MCPVALYDTLLLTFTGEGIHLTCSHPEVPEDASNLAARAAGMFLEAASPIIAKLPSGINIHIDKKIPVGAGLGGGSSNAASVLKGLNDFWGMPFGRRRLMELGVRIGADVPFFIQGEPALATGIGEQLEPFPRLTPWTALLVYPNEAVSTARVYKNLNLRLTKDEKKLRKFHFGGRFYNAADHLVNDLEPVTAKALPVINKIKRLLLAHGAAGAMMSGSGSSVFGLFETHKRANSAYSALCSQKQSQNWALYVADLLISGSAVV